MPRVRERLLAGERGLLERERERDRLEREGDRLERERLLDLLEPDLDRLDEPDRLRLDLRASPSSSTFQLAAIGDLPDISSGLSS